MAPNDEQLETGPIAVDRLTNVTVSARGELFDGSSILAQSYPPGYAIERRDAAKLANVAERARNDAEHLRGEWLFVTDHWSDNYYHWLCEALPRLEALVEARGGGRLLVPAHVHAMAFVRQSLAAWPEIEVTPFETGLLAEKLIVPGHVAAGGRQHPELTVRVAERLERKFGLHGSRTGTRRVYVSRRGALKRRIANETALEPLLTGHGFEAVDFEAMDLRDQIALMHETAELAGPHGAGFANMVFMPRGGQIIELRQEEGPPDTFANLAAMCGHDHRRLHCRSADPDTHVHAADLVVDVLSFEAMLNAE